MKATAIPRIRHGCAFEPLERRNLLTGVTLITHGFGGSVDGWVSEMANAIFDRAAGDDVQFVVEVTDPGHDDGPLEVKNIARSGPLLTSSTTNSPNISILLDWSDVAGSFFPGSHVRSTSDVAAAVAQALVTPNFLEGLAAPLAELPLHLIGHSRGGSLVGALAGNLGLRGIWVDHVTTLDPHPVDGIRDPFGFDFDDAPMVAWESVVFWDNYWRTDGATSFDFTGETISGTHSLQLVESVLDNFTGYSTEHSDVHLWYHGTVDTTGPIDDGSASVSENAGWYAGTMGPRADIGFNYSRIGGRPRPADGISDALALGEASRIPFATRAIDRWPSLVDFQLSSEAVVELGNDIVVDYYWHDFDSATSLTFFLDTDRNPYNGSGARIGAPRELAATTSDSLEFESLNIATSNIDSGQYYLLAQITDSTRSRLLYAADQLELVEPPVETFDVVSFAPTTTGFIATFSQPLDAGLLNLHRGEQPDIIFAGQATGPVIGSVAISRSGNELTFVKSAGLLAADTYSVLLRSAVDGFSDRSGRLLDGDDDGDAGGDYTISYSVAATEAIVVSLPDFVRGPGQAVHLPAEFEEGIPLSLSNGTGVRSVEISIQYDPALLTITGASAAPTAPPGSTVTIDSTTPGLTELTFVSPTALSAGSSTFVNLEATVPPDADQHYARGQNLDLHSISLRNDLGELLPHRDDDAFHVAAYFGDVTGNRRVNAADASQLASVAALLEPGFSATPLVDPNLLADISGNRRVNALDASLVAQFAALLFVPEIPPIPATGATKNPLGRTADSTPWRNQVDKLFGDEFVDGRREGQRSEAAMLPTPARPPRSFRSAPALRVDGQQGSWSLTPREGDVLVADRSQGGPRLVKPQ